MADIEDRYTDLEKRVSDIDSRQKALDAQYRKDLEGIYNILKKLEHKIVGGGLDDSENLGVVAEMRDIKREMGENNIQTASIKKSVEDIQKQLLPSQQLSIDVAMLKATVEGLNKYRWISYGFIVLSSLILSNIKSLTPLLRPP